MDFDPWPCIPRRQHGENPGGDAQIRPWSPKPRGMVLFGVLRSRGPFNQIAPFVFVSSFFEGRFPKNVFFFVET